MQSPASLVTDKLEHSFGHQCFNYLACFITCWDDLFILGFSVIQNVVCRQLFVLKLNAHFQFFFCFVFAICLSGKHTVVFGVFFILLIKII